jgi:hypothetical protein
MPEDQKSWLAMANLIDVLERFGTVKRFGTRQDHPIPHLAQSLRTLQPF